MSEPATPVAPERPVEDFCGTPHRQAWVALARAHAAVTGRLQEALTSAGLPPLAWFEVLATISEASERQLRMGELAEALVISRGGLTKLVDRLIKAGLLERSFCKDDRRVSYAKMLPAGEQLLDEMRPVVSAELDVAFDGNLSAGEAQQLRESLERLSSAACGTA